MDFDPRILIIAPDADGVSWASEIQYIARHFNRPVILTGTVTLDRITSVTVDGEFDVVHGLFHCGPKGALLSNGERWDLTDMLGTVRHVGAQLFFLNGCESAIPGSYLKQNGVPATIAWLNEVIDKRALRIAAYYYEKLIEIGDYSEAFNAVNPRDGTMELFANGSYIHTGIEMLKQEIAKLTRHVKMRDWLIILIFISLIALAIAVAYQTYTLHQLMPQQ